MEQSERTFGSDVFSVVLFRFNHQSYPKVHQPVPLTYPRNHYHALTGTNPRNFKNQTAIVTGGAHGIGDAVAESLFEKAFVLPLLINADHA